ncbi:MAG TPA: FAD-dependent oxidoreductase [Bacilli bacterium]|nr:FAD-dependent oxidoreductase [Bacilli bacterium]
MKTKTIIVVGGVAGGMSFATRYKRLKPHDRVLVFDKGPYVSFANCGLPYALSNVISQRRRLIVETKERLEARFGIEVYPEHEVVSVNDREKSVTVRNATGEEVYNYDALVLSPGAKPFMLNIPGLKAEDTFVLRNIPDLDRMMERLSQEAQSAIVIGAGFIGLEVAENLKIRGLDVTIVEKAPHVLPPFDEEMASFAADELVKHGVRVFANNEVVEVKDKVAVLASGDEVKFDLVVMSVGVIPDTDFINMTNIERSNRGAIIVDENYMTSVSDIYAVGDAILVPHFITGDLVSIALASPANRQGRQVADLLAGLPAQNKGSLGTAILKLFDLAFASTGLNERQLKMAGLPYERLYLLSYDHALYYPKPKPINLKIMFNKESGQVYGAQALGINGVDKRIDIIATAIKANYPITSFPELEFTYAPPFGMAKDIVNYAGYYASNVILNLTNVVEWEDVPAKRKEGAILIDVRSAYERNRFGYIKDTLHIPLDNLRAEIPNLPRDKDIILYCESGIRSYNAERMLVSEGFRAFNLSGSYTIYAQAYPDDVIK